MRILFTPKWKYVPEDTGEYAIEEYSYAPHSVVSKTAKSYLRKIDRGTYEDEAWEDFENWLERFRFRVDFSSDKKFAKAVVSHLNSLRLPGDFTVSKTYPDGVILETPGLDKREILDLKKKIGKAMDGLIFMYHGFGVEMA